MELLSETFQMLQEVLPAQEKSAPLSGGPRLQSVAHRPVSESQTLGGEWAPLPAKGDAAAQHWWLCPSTLFIFFFVDIRKCLKAPETSAGFHKSLIYFSLLGEPGLLCGAQLQGTSPGHIRLDRKYGYTQCTAPKPALVSALSPAALFGFFQLPFLFALNTVWGCMYNQSPVELSLIFYSF